MEVERTGYFCHQFWRDSCQDVWRNWILSGEREEGGESRTNSEVLGWTD